MHIVLGALGSIVTILILLNALAEAGIDLGGLNPFLWQRRRKWRQKLERNPIYDVDSPMEATALLVTATVKADGDMSSEEKKGAVSLFQNEFNLSKRDSADLLVSSSYLFGRGDEVRADLEKVLKPSLENFTEEQAQSALDMLDAASKLDSSGNELKREFVARVRNVFEKRFNNKGKWT